MHETDTERDVYQLKRKNAIKRPKKTELCK